MTDHPFKKLRAERAEDLCRDIELDLSALDILASGLGPAEFLGALIERAMFPDAVKFLARALPKREAAWWACLCARSVLDDPPPDPLLRAVEAAEQWVYDPSEEHRRAAYAAAQAAQFAHAASWAAMAAFWSGGSMAPPDVPAVPPADNLTGKAAAGAVMLAAVQTEPERAAEKYRLFLKRGIDIASGGNGRLA